MDVKLTKLLQGANDKLADIAKRQKENKNQRVKIMSEIAEAVPKEESDKIIAVAKADFEPAQKRWDDFMRTTYAAEKQRIDDATLRYHNTVDLLGYRVKKGLPRLARSIRIEGNNAVITHQGKTANIPLGPNNEMVKAIETAFDGITAGASRSKAYQARLQAGLVNGNNK